MSSDPATKEALQAPPRDSEEPTRTPLAILDGGLTSDNGPPATRVEIYDVAELTSEELGVMERLGPAVAPHSLKSLRAKHHKAAYLIACGNSLQTVSRICAMPETTLAALVDSPAFHDLLQTFKDEVADEVSDARSVQAKIEMLHEDALDLLGHELETNPRLSPAFLLQTANSLGDRAGHSPIQRIESKSLNMTLTREDIDALKQLGRSRQRGSIRNAGQGRPETEIEVQATRPSDPEPPTSKDPETE